MLSGGLRVVFEGFGRTCTDLGQTGVIQVLAFGGRFRTMLVLNFLCSELF